MSLKEIARHLFETDIKMTTKTGRFNSATEHADYAMLRALGATPKQARAAFDIPEPEEGSEIISTPRFDALEQEVLGVITHKTTGESHENYSLQARAAEALCIPLSKLETCMFPDGDAEDKPLMSVRVPSAVDGVEFLKALDIPKEFLAAPVSPTSPRELAMSPCIGGGMAKDHPASFTPLPSPEPKRLKAEGMFTIHEEAANTPGAQERLAYAKEMFKKFLVPNSVEQPRLVSALKEKRLDLLSVVAPYSEVHFSICDSLHAPGLFVEFWVKARAVNLPDAWEVLMEGLAR